jgi:hypothetical protein
VILTGMHRSGTTLVARCLHAMGLFLGNRVERNCESTFFLSINEGIFRRVNATWDNPAPVKFLAEQADAMRMVTRCLLTDLHSPRIRSYLGLRRYVRYRSIERFDQSWGWKDPRTIFTLPNWTGVFPDAKIVYVVRHGVDVAQSLTSRAMDKLDAWKRKHDQRIRRPGSRSALRRASFQGSTRCLSLDRSFSLWDEYLTRADEVLAVIRNDRLVVRYEDLLRSPQSHLSDLVKFCGLPLLREDHLQEIIALMNPARANAYATNPALKDFYARVKDNHWMRHYGYAIEETGR